VPTADDSPAERAERLLELGRALTAELRLDVVLERILATARELTGARYAALGILDERRRELEDFFTSGIDADGRRAIGHLPRGRGILGLLIDQPEPIRLDHVSAHPRSYGFPPGHPPMDAFLGAPIRIRGEAWGNLYLTEKEGGGPFDADDERSIVLLAEYAAIAVDNARLYARSEERGDELERAVRGLEASTDIALALGGETDLHRILELIAKRARALVEAEALLILLRDGDELCVAAHAGTGDPDPAAALPVEGSTSGRALTTQRPVRVDDVRDGLLVGADRLGLPDARSALLVPLVFRGRGLGVLAAFDHRGERATFDADDERALRSFAASAATAVATARTVEEQRLRDSLAAAEAERKRWARDLHDETLQGLGALKLALAASLRAEPDRARAMVAEAVDLLTAEIGGLRQIIADLRPAALDELGLEPAVRTLVTRVAEREGLAVRCTLALGDERLAPEIETVAYRVVQEALTNVVKHAGAATVEVTARREDGGLRVVVADDGRGLAAGPAGGGFGLVGMRERAELAGGTLAVEDAAPGTRVTLTLPLG
jgi:signal transduction histidine kinase